MKIMVLTVGETQDKYIETGVLHYLKKLQHYVKVEELALILPKKLNSLPADEKKVKEGELILKQIEIGDILILLDEKGIESNSRQFADFLQKQMNLGQKRLVLVIGGAFGFSKEVYLKANGQISLSRMTFNHQMIRLFLMEQLYRGFSILKGEPYHND